MRIENKYTVIDNEPFGLLDCNLETKKEVNLFDTEEEYIKYCAEKGIMIPQLQVIDNGTEDVEAEILEL